MKAGDRKDLWLVLSEWESIKRGSILHKQLLCVCDCGTFRVIDKVYITRKRNSMSCGCLVVKNAATIAERFNFKHGYGNSKVYKCWTNLKLRCNDPENSAYADYGGRGISYCESWEKFENFLADMGEPPSSKHSLDRVNTNGNYCKENCCWQTASKQVINRRKLSNNTSGRTGVQFHKKAQKWMTLIAVGGMKYEEQYFSTFEEAVRAREILELKYHGCVRSDVYEESRI